jgi:hypothetical protein
MYIVKQKPHKIKIWAVTFTGKIMLQGSVTPFEWVSEHLHTIGWPILCFFAWRVSAAFTEIKARVIAEHIKFDQLHAQCTNHMPTSLREILEELKEQRKDWQQWFESLDDEPRRRR